MRFLISCSDVFVERLDEVARRSGNTRNGIVNIALLEFLERYSQFFGLDDLPYKNTPLRG